MCDNVYSWQTVEVNTFFIDEQKVLKTQKGVCGFLHLQHTKIKMNNNNSNNKSNETASAADLIREYDTILWK